jgi:GxxExxY protein
MENLDLKKDFEKELIYKNETGKIIGICMEIHNNLRNGFREVVYKDAIEKEFIWNNISFEREKKFKMTYKGVALRHYYVADFIIDNKIILEIKAQRGAAENDYRQVINYLSVASCKVGLLINFGEPSLKFKRVVL